MSERVHGRTVDLIQSRIQDDILAGDFDPGERLAEVALAKRYEVSRGPIRAALANLTDAGLVVDVPNSGARVRQITLADARALYETRTALECAAGRLAAERATPADIAQLEMLLSEHRHEISTHPAGAYLQSGSDRDFHLVIARMSGNPIIERILARELYPQLSLLRKKHEAIRGRGREALREHERILEAIARKEPDVADLLMRGHIANSWAMLSTTMSAGLAAADPSQAE